MPGRSFSFGIIGAALALFSQAAALMLAGLGIALALLTVADFDRKTLRLRFTVLMLWGAGAAAAVLAGMNSMTPATRAYMSWYWQFGFPPRSWDAFPWLWHELYNTWDNSNLFYPLAWLYISLPPLVAVARHLPVYRVEETKPMLTHVEAHHRPGDTIYVYYGAAQAYAFYGPHFGMRSEDAVIGGCHSGELRAFLHEVDSFRGRARMWVLFAHDFPRPLERPTIKGYLSQIGIRRDESERP